MKKLVIGITGSFGTGKTTVTSFFRKLGSYTISADSLAQRLILPKGRLYKKVLGTFGKDILKKNKTINRAKLANIVFGDKKKLKKLNSIIHPEVIRQINLLIKKSSKSVVVIDVPLLVESGLHNFVDKLIVVKAKRNIQIARCLKRGFKKENIRLRIQSQLSLAKKISLADFVIDNSKSKKLTEKQVKSIWRRIKNGGR